MHSPVGAGGMAYFPNGFKKFYRVFLYPHTALGFSMIFLTQ